MELDWELSSNVYLHIFIAITSIGLTLTWERLRQHSKMIDCLSIQTKYLSTMTYWTMVRLMQRMESIHKDVETLKDMNETSNAMPNECDPIPAVYPDNIYDYNTSNDFDIFNDCIQPFDNFGLTNKIVNLEAIINSSTNNTTTDTDSKNDKTINYDFKATSAGRNDGDGGQEVEEDVELEFSDSDLSSHGWSPKVDTIW